MAGRVWIEAAILVGIGVASLIEAVRLILNRDVVTVQELIGPDVYVLLLGIALVVAGLLYLWTNYREPREAPAGPWSAPKIDARLAGTFLITAAYVYSIGTLGYFVSSLLFLAAAFRCAGVSSWRVIALLSVGISSCYYILFVRYCEVIFPKGILF